MRKRITAQTGIDFQQATLPETEAYYAKYEKIDSILRGNPEILKAIHRDIAEHLKKINKRERDSNFSSDNVLRIAIAQVIEGESLRSITIRVDESGFLRKFTRIYNGKMMSYSHFCTLRNKIRPETWAKVNVLLAKDAVEKELISGEYLRMDTTAVETNVHYPTDSSLLWDTYRKLAGLIRMAREISPRVAVGRRLQDKRAKKVTQRIARILSKKGRSSGRDKRSEKAKPLYCELIRLVDDILDLGTEVRNTLSCGKKTGAAEGPVIERGCIGVVHTIDHYLDLGRQVLSQTVRRIIRDEKVSSQEKLFSIFEPHTEMLIRGKSGKPLEFGHMVLLQQVRGCFITGYDVFNPQPDESKLTDEIVARHVELFGAPPKNLGADKGFYASMQQVRKLEELIETVSICKKGRRTQEEEAREHTRAFREGQRFRAGIEGSISVLKRCFALARCLRKGFEYYAAFVGNAIFAHNLCVLARC